MSTRGAPDQPHPQARSGIRAVPMLLSAIGLALALAAARFLSSGLLD